MPNELKIENDDLKYDIDLNNFEKVTLHNKHEYIKFINKKDNSVIMIDITNINMPLTDYMKSLQDSSISYKTNDAKKNASGLINQQQKQNTNLTFDSVENVNLNNINDSEKRKIVSMFVQNKDRFMPKIKYVNTIEGIALNELGQVVEFFYDDFTKKYEPRYANTIAVKSEEKLVNNTFQGSYDGIDFEATMDYLEIDNKEIPIGNETISLKEIEAYDGNEEELKSAPMSEDKKAFILRLLDVYRKRKLQNNEKLVNDPPKVLIKKIPKKNENGGFANQSLMIFLSGFTVGVLLAIILYFIIKMFV